MEDNKNLVTEVTEKVEHTTEETPKTYTEAEFNDAVNIKVKEVMGSKLARKEAKIRKEFDRKYGDLVDTLKTGTGMESVEDITTAFKDHYKGKGIEFKSKPEYSSADVEVLAASDANEVIKNGFDEVIEEADRLKEIGVENMTAREKATFLKLTDYIKNTETVKELEKIGVSKDEYESEDFKTFAKQFNSSTPIEKVYEIYTQTKPQKQIKTAGSMKSTSADDDGIKDFYTPDEARRFTTEQYRKNPKLLDAVTKSMQKW